MAIAEVIKFEGSPDELVWKYPLEDFTATSQLIVDETHEALLVVNGNAADLFGPGRRTLAVPNIPLANKLINIPTGGKSPFPCKVFFINKVHQMDLLWGTQGPITLEDPVYEIFMHVMLHGNLSLSVEDSRKFMLKIVGFRNDFNVAELVQKFRGIISSHVKDCVSKIMIKGKLSYFEMNASLFELSEVIKEKLDVIFEDYGVIIRFFNIESIEVPDGDYAAITQAKSRRSSRIIEGYSWQEERQMDIAEKFAGNEGTMGSIGGAVGGFMMGGAFSGSVADIARNALNPERVPTQRPPKDVTQAGGSSMNNQGSKAFGVAEFFENGSEIESSRQTASNPDGAGNTGAVQQGYADVSQTGYADTSQRSGRFCQECGMPVPEGAKFCANCGKPMAKVCPVCRTPVAENARFCHNCGNPVG